MDEGSRSCSVEGCSRSHWSRGMCSLHYQRWRRHGSPDITFRAANGTSDAGCSVTGCGYVDPHGLVHGLCRKHFQRQRGAYHVGKPTIEARTCAYCGQSYRPKRRDSGSRVSIYCSRTCKGRAKTPKRDPRICPHCGEQFAPRHTRQFLCSQSCRAAAHRLQSKFRSRVGEKARPGIWRARIGERDKWRCGICRKQVNRNLRFPHPMSASLDHVIPVSKGGTNDEWNLRLTHLKCNRDRGNRGVAEQLAML